MVDPWLPPFVLLPLMNLRPPVPLILALDEDESNAKIVIDREPPFKSLITVDFEQTPDRLGCRLLVYNLSIYQIGFNSADIASFWDICVTPSTNDPPPGIPALEKDRKFSMFGKPCVMHRSMGFFSPPEVKGYYFARTTIKGQALTGPMIRLLELFGRLTGGAFNSLLFNYYQGEDYLSAHSDNQDNLTDQGVIALSLGGSRTFRVKNVDKQPHFRFDHETGDGEILWMEGCSFQQLFSHEILKGRPNCQPRLSITARYHRE